MVLVEVSLILNHKNNKKTDVAPIEYISNPERLTRSRRRGASPGLF